VWCFCALLDKCGLIKRKKERKKKRKERKNERKIKEK
jgi:hypothetical protein